MVLIQVMEKDRVKTLGVLLDHGRPFNGFHHNKYGIYFDQKKVLKKLDQKKVNYKIL